MIANQLKRQSDDLLRLRASLDTKTESENRLEKQVRESKRQYADLEFNPYQLHQQLRRCQQHWRGKCLGGAGAAFRSLPGLQ